MTTVADLITDSLMELGVLAEGETLPAAMGQSALRRLNQMLATWNTEDLMIYTVDRSVFSFVPAKQAYTIGVGGDLVATYAVRPGQIDMASVLVNGVEIPIEILNDEQWRDVTLKSTSSTFPLQMWANGNYPLNTLYFWPIPTEADSLVLYLWSQLADFADVNSTVSLPQGYEEAIISNLALRLAPSYGKTPSQLTLSLAASGRAHIKKMNFKPTYRSVDSALGGSRSSIGQRSRGYVID